MIIRVKSGNVCLLTIKDNPVTNRVIVDVEWSKHPSKKDVREIEAEVREMMSPTSTHMPPLIIEDDKEREAYTSEFLNPSGNAEKQ